MDHNQKPRRRHPIHRLLAFGFRLLYNELAWTYDFVAWFTSAGQWRSWQRAALPELLGTPVLEIAHGTGDMLLDLTALGRAPVGLDRSPAMGRLAARKLRRRAVSAPLVRADVRALPFPAGCFPCLLSTFPAEFIYDPVAVGEFYRVLQPGGRLVCAPNAVNTGRALHDRVSRLLYRLTGQSIPALLESWLALYRAAGFRVMVKIVALPRSRVDLILAEKPAREGASPLAEFTNGQPGHARLALRLEMRRHEHEREADALAD